MRIHTRAIPEEGVTVTEILLSEGIGEDNGLQFSDSFEIKASVTKKINEIVAKIEVHAKYTAQCCLCLIDIEEDFDRKFSLRFPTQRNMESLEIGDDIRQEIVLNLPSRILCQEKCKGLCLDCGVNLNNEQCKNKDKVVI